MSTRRTVLTMAAATPVLATAAAFGPVAAQAAKRNYVLVHGAWHGGWCWAPVADRLRAAGHTVFTPTLTGNGERKHLISKDITLETAATDVINVLEYEELRDVYLVGHSFGGQVAASAVDRAPERVKRLVFLDGGWPENGRSVFDSLPPDVRASRYKVVEEKGGGVGVPVVDAGLFGITDPQQAAWVNRRLTPQPIGTYTSPAKMSNPVGNGKPVTFIRCTSPRFSSVDQYEELARKQPSWQLLEIATAHDAMVIKPEETAKLLLELP